MENIGGAVFFIAVVLMFGVTAYLYFYGEDLNLKFWESDSNESAPVPSLEENVAVNDTEIESNETDNEVNSTSDSIINETNDGFSNISYPHWDHSPITYKILNKQKCWGNPLQAFEDAVGTIEDGANGKIDFLEVVGSDYDIGVRCVDKTSFLEYLETNNKSTCRNETFDYNKQDFDAIVEGFVEEEDYYVSDRVVKRNDSYSSFEVCYYDTSSVSVENSSWSWFFESEPKIENGIIKNFSMSIFDEASWSGCAKIPAREIHELFHGLGFAHSSMPPYYPGYGWSPADFDEISDIMFKYRYCTFQKTVDEKYFDCLENIYSNGEEEICEGVDFL